MAPSTNTERPIDKCRLLSCWHPPGLISPFQRTNEFQEASSSEIILLNLISATRFRLVFSPGTTRAQEQPPLQRWELWYSDVTGDSGLLWAALLQEPRPVGRESMKGGGVVTGGGTGEKHPRAQESIGHLPAPMLSIKVWLAEDLVQDWGKETIQINIYTHKNVRLCSQNLFYFQIYGEKNTKNICKTSRCLSLN